MIEFLEVIEPLTEDFHVVIPAIPGYGFSGPVDDHWDVPRIARAWQALMAELGYERYGAQGGDWGSAISRELGRIDPEHCVGVHLNLIFSAPIDDDTRAQLDPADLERHDAGRKRFRGLSGYMQIQARKPMTLAYGLTDSPVGQLAWIAEQFHEWAEHPIDRDVLLTNVMFYWLTGTAGSSAQLYYESAGAWGRLEPSSTPTAVALFPAELNYPIRALAERTDNIVRWTEMARGGHFAALEAPELLVAGHPGVLPVNVLVIGGTVFVGRAVVEAALARGDEVTIFHRGQHGRGLYDVETILGDRRTDLGRLNGRSWDRVVDTCGFAPEDITAIDCGTYAFVSTAGVYRDWPLEPIAGEEAALHLVGDDYSALKAATERAADAAMPDRVAHIRPGVIVGPRENIGRLPYWLERIARGGRVLAPEPRDAPIQLIDARDLAAFCLDAPAGAFNAISRPGAWTWGELLETVSGGRQPRCRAGLDAGAAGAGRGPGSLGRPAAVARAAERHGGRL